MAISSAAGTALRAAGPCHGRGAGCGLPRIAACGRLVSLPLPCVHRPAETARPVGHFKGRPARIPGPRAYRALRATPTGNVEPAPHAPPHWAPAAVCKPVVKNLSRGVSPEVGEAIGLAEAMAASAAVMFVFIKLRLSCGELGATPVLIALRRTTNQTR